MGVAQIELPKDRELVEGAPTYLTGAVKNLKATIKPPRIPGAAYLSPVHDDFAILARLPKLKTLIVVVKSFLGDKRTSEFGVSTVDINLSAESPLRRERSPSACWPQSRLTSSFLQDSTTCASSAAS